MRDRRTRYAVEKVLNNEGIEVWLAKFQDSSEIWHQLPARKPIVPTADYAHATEEDARDTIKHWRVKQDKRDAFKGTFKEVV